MVIATTFSSLFLPHCTATQPRPVPNVALRSPRKAAIECFVGRLGQLHRLPQVPVSINFASGFRGWGWGALKYNLCRRMQIRGRGGGTDCQRPGCFLTTGGGGGGDLRDPPTTDFWQTHRPTTPGGGGGGRLDTHPPTHPPTQLPSAKWRTTGKLP